MRSLFSIGSLVLVCAWLILSYLPVSIFSPPQLSMPGQAYFPIVLLLILFIFVAIQVELVRSTLRIFHADGPERHSPAPGCADPEPPAASERAAAEPFKLRFATEFIWTIVPLLATIGLAVLISWQWIHG